MSSDPVRAELAESESALAGVRAEWDRLAVAGARPYCAPAWQLGWWRHAAPAGAELRAVVVRDGDSVIGIAPFFAERGRYRLLASPVCARTVPLAEAGREPDVATAIARVIADGHPRPAQIQLDGVEAGSPWPGLLAEAWGAKAVELERQTAPVINLDAPDYEQWFGTRSRNFRQQMRRRRRALEEEMGAEFRLAGPDDLERWIGELERLHFERRGDRPSDAFGPGIDAMLADAGRELLASDRFRIWAIATGDATVSAQLFLVAGGEMVFWNGGFDDAFRDQSPGVQAILAAVADAIDLGCGRLELGAGDQDYKLRLTDDAEELVTVAIVPAGAAGIRARVGLARLRVRRALAGAAPEGLKRRLRSLRGSET